MRAVWVALIVAGWFVGPGIVAPWAEAREIYVDNVMGNDLFNGLEAQATGGKSGPVRSIGRALKICRKMDHIVLANTGQPYRECVSLTSGRHCGEPSRPFVINGNGATLDGTRSVAPELWRHVQAGVFRYQPDRLAYQQLYWNGRPAQRITPGPDRPLVPVRDLKPTEWCLHDGFVYFRCEPNRWIHDYALSVASHPVGITLYQVQHVVVVDLVVQGFQVDGFSANDTRDCTLLGVVSRGNGRSGVAVLGAARLLVDNSLVGDNGFAQVLTDGLCHVHLRDTQLLPATAPEVIRREGRVTVETTPEAAEPAGVEGAAPAAAAP